MGKYRIRRIIILAASLIFISLIFCSCSNQNPDKQSKQKISIAFQYGLAYAPLEIMKQEKIMEKNMPGIEIEWKQLGNTVSIREAMLANEVDVGFMAIPPFLVGYDKGMKWKIACGLSSSPVGLVTYKDNIKSIKDFSKDDRIAMPQPGSIQHILLSMACERELGDPHRLDDILVTLSHPDGVNALSAKKEISAHFTTPPYLSKELDIQGFHQILSGKDAMGSDFTFIIGVTTDKFHNNIEVYKAFKKSIEQSIEFLNNTPEKSASLLSKVYGISEEDVIKYLKSDDAKYGLEVKGAKRFADFMKKNGYISKSFDKADDIAWDDVKYEN